MSQYEQLVKALRGKFIAYDATGNHNSAQLFKDAADAIEALQYEIRESMQKCAECGDRCVEVVQCKECIHFTQGGWCDREFDWFPVDKNDFCSMAEKMEVQYGKNES